MKAEDSEEKLAVKKEELRMESGQSLAGLSDVEVRLTVEWGELILRLRKHQRCRRNPSFTQIDRHRIP